MTAVTAYLDYNATAPIRPSAAKAVASALELLGNPSSVHRFGRLAHGLLESSRESVAAFVNAQPGGVIFTSGGSEANALALTGFPGRRVLTSAIEHPSVLAFGQTTPIAVDSEGVVDLGRLEEALALAQGPSMVAVMLANNETGVIEPLAAVSGLAHRYGALVHCDAVQAAGRMGLDIHDLGVDSLSISAHKLGGPPGVGALVLADPDAAITPLLRGGGQERRRRAGTENLPGIAGFAAAIADCHPMPQLSVWRDRIEQRLCQALPNITIFSQSVSRLPGTSCLALPGISAKIIVMALDLAGVAVSAGAACSSGKVAASHVLEAMGAGGLAETAIRVSMGWASQARDADIFVEAFLALAERLGQCPAGSAELMRG
ncbi:MAG TPA: aminotransferase class V-fold PLP-dependent enzyme [Rhodospirillaceae bacterium]|nr:aminotransferase class V-fold PLP-dependent enzyme [Rhodospirillaceae bacterium]